LSSVQAEITTSPLLPAGALGDACRGAVLTSTGCGPKLTCWRSHPVLGADGICVPEANVNERCQTHGIRYPAQCIREARCQFESKNDAGDEVSTEAFTMAGLSGTCKAIPQPLGGRCGGGLKHQIPCKVGLFCDVKSMLVGEEVGPYGKCVKSKADGAPAAENVHVGSVGDSCGGDFSFLVQCAEGLTCHKPKGAALAGGQCLPLSQDGGQCGGGTRFPSVCKPNSDCTFPNGTAPGRKGVCQEHFNEETEECGGSTQYSFRCREGLSCVKLSALMGAKGHCRKVEEE